MNRSHLIIPDAHAHPDFNNDRFDWLSLLIRDLKPDVVINLGDGADMPSLCSYDKGKGSFIGRTYRKDIDAFLDSQDRLWSPLRRAKKRLPQTIYLIGNHEERIGRALNAQPELQGTISFDDLELDRWYDQVVPYDGGTPGVIDVDGVHYAHYFVSGVMCRPIGGEHPAYSLLAKRMVSSTCGHIHTGDYCIRTKHDGNNGRKVHGLVAGVYQDYRAGFAGMANDLWWRGVIFKEGVENGDYNVRWISLDSIKKEYS